MIKMGWQGWSSHRGRKLPSLPLLVALQMRQDPARRQEATDEAGSEPNGDFLHRAQERRMPQGTDSVGRLSANQELSDGSREFPAAAPFNAEVKD